MPYKYFTTPIYYANGNPHAGHIYTTILGSILTKHYKSRQVSTQFLTGLDEHGEAVEDKARELGVTPQSLVDSMAVKWQKTFADFEIDYNIFLRTTNSEHIRNVQDILAHCHNKGDIYYGEHEGYYCIKCESFLTNSERDENNLCIVHKRPTELRKEGNYFFRTSKYKEQLKQLIKNNQITVQERFSNELLSLIEQLEGDLSISRPKTRLTWGVELPFDSNHVAYVWFDALPNYVTGIGGLENAKNSPYWTNAYHLLGKDILKFHGVFWPAMCLSLDIPVPKLFVHGWLLKDGHKMSKSLGNVLTVEQILHYGRDMFTNFVFRAVNPGEDIDISWKTYFERYNSDLANGIGNLLSRTLTMVEKYFLKKIPEFSIELLTEEQKELLNSLSITTAKVTKLFDDFKVAEALNEIWQIIAKTDRYITAQKPWEIAKNNNSQSLSNVLATTIACLRAVGYLAYPFFPAKMLLLLNSIGEKTNNISNFYNVLSDSLKISSGYEFAEIPKLYNRLDVATELEKLVPLAQMQIKPEGKPANDKENMTKNNSKQAAMSNSEKTPPSHSEYINIDDFAKVDMRVGTVISAEIVESSDKLLKLIVSLGDVGKRQILSGIRQWIRPEEIVNKKVVVVVNLAPRKMKFGISEGMMLATDTVDEKVCPIFLPEELKEGAKLS